MTVSHQPKMGAVVLAFQDEPLLGDCLQALLDAQVDRVAVVDNGFSSAQHLPADDRITWVVPGFNSGFTGGCNLGAAAIASEVDVLIFVNSDLIVQSDALSVLTAALAQPQVGLVSGLVVLLDQPDTINSAGNPVHYTMLSWAGDWGKPAQVLQNSVPIASASGALMAMRTADWQRFAGLHDELFAYGEDVELSLRVWLAGMQVLLVPGAVGAHDYEFSRNPHKFYLLERNRLINVLTIFQPSTIVVLLPGLLALEAAILIVALRDGIVAKKLAGYYWIWANRELLRQRRRQIAGTRMCDDAVLFRVLSTEITPAAASGVHVPAFVNFLFGRYGRAARGVVIRSSQRRKSRKSMGNKSMGKTSAQVSAKGGVRA